ncbi:MAG: DUF1080 domain-containing protein [Acidobacteria bacterium]|nr:DUF1080 domain-containing protein [Acidobacteriota bacterium]
MVRFLARSFLLAALLAPGLAQAKANPFLGRWNFNFETPNGTRASWLSVAEKNGALEVWFQPTGGNVYQVRQFKLKGTHLKLMLSKGRRKHPALRWELTANGGVLSGVQKRGKVITPLTGAPAPELNRPAPASWTDPEPLFDGKTLNGWEPIGNPANSHWAVQDGLLVNEAHGANLMSVRKFNDFRLHFEVNCPDGGNSGFYLRGRYEIQIEYEPLTANPPNRRIGSIYGRIAPKVELPRTPGKWETFDVTLVGRTLTVVRNGVTTIDAQEIEGITGGALDGNEEDPGPFYIQGDHTGGLKFRNITISVPKS